MTTVHCKLPIGAIWLLHPADFTFGEAYTVGIAYKQGILCFSAIDSFASMRAG